MRRKVIQIGDSTQLISLPRKWAQKYGIKKSDELEIEERGDQVVVNAGKGNAVETTALDINDLGVMLPRYIHALYKKGIDEIRVTFSKPELLDLLKKSLGKETVGYEIIDQGKDFCVIKNVLGDLEAFSSVLRRTFLLLLSMADDGLDAVVQGDSKALLKVIPLEEENNRLTTTCRRLLNKKGGEGFTKIGPIYYVIEEIEKIADQYKYMFSYLADRSKFKVSKQTIEVFEEVNKMLRAFYELFYKFDKQKMVLIGEKRKKVVSRWYALCPTVKDTADKVLLHNLLVISQKIFCLIGPYLVLNL